MVVGSVGAANTDVKQEVLSVSKFDKKAKLVEMCEEILINSGKTHQSTVKECAYDNITIFLLSFAVIIVNIIY